MRDAYETAELQRVARFLRRNRFTHGKDDE